MTGIGENIAALRKGKNMTQEALATAIGVSAQAVSKWETGATMPDILLLPILANVFQVRLEALYGLQKADKPLSNDDLLEKLELQLLATTQDELTVRHPDLFTTKADPYSMALSLRDYLREQPDCQTGGFESKRGGVYYSETTGGVVLHKGEGGWLPLLDDEDIALGLETLADPDYRRLLRFLAEQDTAPFTLPMLLARSGLQRGEKAAAQLEVLETQGYLHGDMVHTGEEELRVYQCKHRALEWLLPLFTALTFLKRHQEMRPAFIYWQG